MKPDTIETLRTDIDALIKERDALLGISSALLKAVAVLMQTSPDHRRLNLVLSGVQDAEAFGKLPALATGPAADVEASVIQALLNLQPIAPKA